MAITGAGIHPCGRLPSACRLVRANDPVTRCRLGVTLFADHDVDALLLNLSSVLALSPGGWLPADGRPRRLPFDLSINTAPRRTACAFASASAAEVTSPARDDFWSTTRIVASAAAHNSCVSVVSAIDGATTIMVSAPPSEARQDRDDSFAGHERVAIGKGRTGGQDFQRLDITVFQHIVNQAAVGECVVEAGTAGRLRRVVVCVDQNRPTPLLRRQLGQRFGDVPRSPPPTAIGQGDDCRLGQVFEADEVGKRAQAIFGATCPA